MGTIINGKIYRNVPEKAEGIETESLKVTGESAVEMPSIKATEIEADEITAKDYLFVYDMRVPETEESYNCIQLYDDYEGIYAYSDVGITLEATNMAKLKGSVASLIGSASANVDSETNVSITGRQLISFRGGWDADEDDALTDITMNNHGITIDPDFCQMGDQYLILVNIPTSDPQVAGAVWNDNGTLKISAGQ